jgi:two-component system phosphoglycerate transport system response regulator PgtA
MASMPEKPTVDWQPSSTSGQRILLIDDDESDLRYFTMLLQRLEYAVWAFSSHQEAERYLEQGYYDLVIVSEGEPAFPVHRLARFTLGRERYTPVVVLTRSLDLNRYLEAMRLGACDYLEKPLTPTEFERIVLTHCQPRQPNIAARQSEV